MGIQSRPVTADFVQRLPDGLDQFLIDPLNRYYRVPLTQNLARLLLPTRIQPNHLTLAHMVIGIVGALFLYWEQYPAAVLFLEIRNILDALDGTLARLRGKATALGRTLQMVADGVTFNSLMIAGAARLIQDVRGYSPWALVVGVVFFAVVTAHCGTVYQLMKRKLDSVIHQKLDQVEVDWREHRLAVNRNEASLLRRLGLIFDTLAIQFVSMEWYRKILKRAESVDWEEKALRDAKILNELACISRRRELLRAIQSTAWVSDDNIFALLSFILLGLWCFPQAVFPFVHPILVAFGFGLIFGIVTLLQGLHFLQDFLHGVHRE